eukprot:6207304-Pleurochrysis_carterae.AAC.2
MHAPATQPRDHSATERTRSCERGARAYWRTYCADAAPTRKGAAPEKGSTRAGVVDGRERASMGSSAQGEVVLSSISPHLTCLSEEACNSAV